jgi:hypothetical protein
MKLISAVFTFLALAVLVTAPANAQATRTWVSGVGDDVNPCSRTAPCKTFAGAISKTAAGGEISVLDPGGFGTITINKAITISGDGSLGSVLFAGAGVNGVTVNAGVNDRVVLRNISIQGVGTGTSGIRYLAGKSLLVDNVTISGFTSRGIDVSLATTGNLVVRNTVITNGATGVRVNTTAGNAIATLDNVTLTGLATGVEGATNSRITITNSNISSNSSTGIIANTSTSQINVQNSDISFNEVVGINASVAGAAIRLSNNRIFNNTSSILTTGTVFTSGNNLVAGNGGGNAPNGGAIPVQ